MERHVAPRGRGPNQTASQARLDVTLATLESLVGTAKYDVLEWLGFVFWRDAGDPSTFVCSSLVLHALKLLTGIEFPDNRGRQDPRMALWAAHYYAAGASLQPFSSS